jgi:hypothetical protein
MTPDLINGLYEAFGGPFLLRNCWLTWKAKQVKGVSIITTAFFASWGVWNLYYYPHLDQLWSFAGGCIIVSANALWIGLMIYFRRKERITVDELERRAIEALKDQNRELSTNLGETLRRTKEARAST